MASMTMIQEQPAELRDVIVMTAMASWPRFRVVDVSLVLRVVHLRHAITIPLGVSPWPSTSRCAVTRTAICETGTSRLWR